MLPKIIMTDISAAGKSTITNEYSL
jgi:hypothetical protein